MLYTRACSEVILADFVHCWLCGAAVTAAGRAMPQTVSNCIRCTRLHAGVAIRSVFLCRASGRLTRSAAERLRPARETSAAGSKSGCAATSQKRDPCSRLSRGCRTERRVQLILLLESRVRACCLSNCARVLVCSACFAEGCKPRSPKSWKLARQSPKPFFSLCKHLDVNWYSYAPG